MRNGGKHVDLMSTCRHVDGEKKKDTEKENTAGSLVRSYKERCQHVVHIHDFEIQRIKVGWGKK